MRMKQIILFICILFVSVWPGTSLAAGRKALPPLFVTIAPVQTGVTQSSIQPGETLDFLVTARSMTEAPEMRIRIELTGGAELLYGGTSWSGPVEKNTEKQMKITVRTPAKGKGGIKASISLPHDNKPGFRVETTYILGPDTDKKPHREPRIKKDKRGRDIIESN